MIPLFRTVIDRVKAMFTLDAVLDLEQQFVSRQAERRAELFRAADRYQKEGMAEIAADLRRQADELSERRPLQAVLPFMDDHRTEPATTTPSVRRLEHRRPSQPPLSPQPTATRKKGK